MFIELVDVLRCPNPHEESWLVASADRTEGRDIMEGVLGCPVCRAEFPIRGGLVEFAVPATVVAPDAPPSDEQAMRLAALMDLSNVRSFAILTGAWANNARAMRDLVDAPLLLVNPPTGVELGAGLSGIACADVLPLARRSAHALALDVNVRPAFVQSALAAVRAGGRVVAPTNIELPEGITPLARDESMWVGQVANAAEGLVSLRRNTAT